MPASMPNGVADERRPYTSPRSRRLRWGLVSGNATCSSFPTKMRRTRIVDQPPRDDSPLVPFLRVGPPPDRTTCEGWQQWRLTRNSFIPAPRLSLRQDQALTPRRPALHDLHRTATHGKLPPQEQ